MTPDMLGPYGWRRMASALLLATVAPASVATAQSAGRIVTQPARDVGLDKNKVPPLLEKASDNPYSTAGTSSCTRIRSAIADLTKVLGPDFTADAAKNKRTIVQRGGAAVVNSLIPFRGIVREVSGASAAERRLEAATEAGIARRGFLRGLQSARKCRR